MSPAERLAAIVTELESLGLRCLVLGGHAARFYGVDRMTFDYDLHVALDPPQWVRLHEILQQSVLLGAGLQEGPTWRPADFRRFVIGRLADGREERLEFWRQNHLLAPFDELAARREEGPYGGRAISFLGLDDLIRSKETEREDDWRDVAALEEIADERRLARAVDPPSRIRALAALRSRRGYERGGIDALLTDRTEIDAAAGALTTPIAGAFLAPHRADAPTTGPAGTSSAIVDVLRGPLRKVTPGSGRHLALVEVVRRLYRREAMAADRRDKERVRLG